MLIGSTSQHRTLRLLREYRGKPAGMLIAATPGLADRLVAEGVAEPAHEAQEGRIAPERAVGQSAALEVRK